jgi:molybdopterin-guanine dinucleotide biosynthesis protein A
MRLGVLILAGGNGRRIGKRKAFLKIGNDLLINHVHRVIAQLSEEIIIVINDANDFNHIIKFPLKIKVIEDIKKGIGPMMGIYSGMKNMSSDYALVLPCDSPFLSLELLNYLVSNAENFDAAIPIWSNDFIEPLHSVYRVTSSIEAIESAIDAGEKRVFNMIKRLKKIKYVPVETLQKFDENLLTFYNINYKEDLETARLMMNKKLND